MINYSPVISKTRFVLTQESRSRIRLAIIASVPVLSAILGSRPSIPLLLSLLMFLVAIILLRCLDSKVVAGEQAPQNAESAAVQHMFLALDEIIVQKLHRSMVGWPDFWNPEVLQSAILTNGGHLVLCVSNCTVEFVCHLKKGRLCGWWVPVLAFKNVNTRLAIDSTRAKMLSGIAASPFIAAWSRSGRITLSLQKKNGRTEIVVLPAPSP